MEDFLVRLEKQIWATWLPVVAGSALLLGFFLGVRFSGGESSNPSTTIAAPSQLQPSQPNTATPETRPHHRDKAH